MRPNRSFWILAGFCSLCWVVTGVTLELGLTAVVPCWWAPVRHVGLAPSPACSSGSWLFHLTPLVPLMALTPLAVTTSVVTLVVLGRQVRATRRARRRLVARGLPVPLALEQGALAAGVRPGRLLIVDEGAHSYAFCLGVLRPLVVVSSAVFATLDNEQVAAVLAHEAHHARGRDPAKVAVARALAKGFSFVPVCQDLAAHSRLTCEVLADGDARARVGLPALARALRDLAVQDSVRVVGTLGCGMGDLGVERLSALVTGAVPPCKLRRRSTVVTAGVAALALAALLGAWSTISSTSTGGGTAITSRTCAAPTSAPGCTRHNMKVGGPQRASSAAADG